LCQYFNASADCQYNKVQTPAMLSAMQSQIDAWSGGAIDHKSNVATQKVYLFVGTRDSTVGPNPMLAVQTQYVNNGVEQVPLIQASNVAHVFPTDFSVSSNNPCGASLPPYIANCKYDGAKAVLSAFYGTLNPRNNAPAPSRYVEFSQREFT
jgi:hypothetical protein